VIEDRFGGHEVSLIGLALRVSDDLLFSEQRLLESERTGTSRHVNNIIKPTATDKLVADRYLPA
jgi:hypothetical protein